MKSTQFLLRTAALSLLLPAALAQAATVTGTVTDKTTNKPAAGDTVVLVDVQASMGEVAKAKTDAKGHYSITEPGNGPYLVRVTHQGGSYFIAAPQGDAPGDIPVYDVAAKVDGVSIEADVLEVETDNGQLKVTERYFVHNTGTPPRTQYNSHGFEVVLPSDAVVDGTAARRPTGLPTSTNLKPTGAKGHFTFDFPIQPDEGDKDTLFQLSYHLPYSSGQYTFKPQALMPTANVAVLMPKSMTFKPAAGTSYQPVTEEPNIQTYVMKNAAPGKSLEFTISGTGSIPRDDQGSQAGQQPGGTGGAQGVPGNMPGGGIGTPIGAPDPLTKYKWWILGALALLLAAGAAFLLRKPAGAPAASAAPIDVTAVPSPAPGMRPATPGSRNSALLNVLKEELFALESEKLSGTLSAEEYTEVKAALETVLKRALKHAS